MANQAGFVVENKFINGLITESTAINFPEDSCTATENCVFNEFGQVTRRPGVDTETNAAYTDFTLNTGDVLNDYVWYTSAASSNKAFLIQQKGKILSFYDISDNLSPSSNLQTTLNLDTYLPASSTQTTANFPCQFATGNGDLLITNQVMNPVYVTYLEDTDTVSATTIMLKHRDTDGLPDGLAPGERPTFSVASLKSSNPNHYYNLLNQGWFAGTALSQWDTDLSTLPSNADVIAYYRTDQTDSYNTGSGAAIDPGSSIAPRGHFILNVGEDDRTTAAATEGFTGFTLTGTTGAQQISGAVGTVIGDFATRSAVAFDGNSNKSAGNCAAQTGTSAYIGKNLTAISGSKILGVVVYPSNDLGYVDTSGTTITVELYGKTTAPANATDGTLLGTTGSFTDTVASKYITSSNTSTTYNYVWIRVRRTSGSSDTYRIALARFYAPGSSSYRPRSVAFFAGRAFFAGVDGTDIGSNVYFSQVVTDKTKYGLCYQNNDPSSEKVADLLATDGGVIKIPEMGKVQKLFPFQNSILVFATNGLWQISGNGNDGFAATGYRVRRLSNIGMTSPNSVVDVKGVPMWWAEDGIYTINYDPNYDSSAVKSLTEETIKTLILAVPPTNRQYIRSTFDRLNNYVYFGYLSTAATNAAQSQTFDRLLVFNAKTAAFFPWTFDNTTSNVPMMCGLEYIQDGSRQLGGAVKITTYITVSGQKKMTFAEPYMTTYKDWADAMLQNAGSSIDYSSFLIAGYRVDAQAMRNFQTKYVWTFMNNLSNSSVRLQGLWDFTNNQASGKWSTPQQAYNSLTTKGRTYDDVRISRRVVRGSGKALQVKYYSESGKPFSLIGWGIYETGTDAP